MLVAHTYCSSQRVPYVWAQSAQAESQVHGPSEKCLGIMQGRAGSTAPLANLLALPASLLCPTISPAAAAASAADADARAAWAEAVEAAERALSSPPDDSQTLKGPGPAGLLLRSAPAAQTVLLQGASSSLDGVHAQRQGGKSDEARIVGQAGACPNAFPLILGDLPASRQDGQCAFSRACTSLAAPVGTSDLAVTSSHSPARSSLMSQHLASAASARNVETATPVQAGHHHTAIPLFCRAPGTYPPSKQFQGSILGPSSLPRTQQQTHEGHPLPSLTVVPAPWPQLLCGQAMLGHTLGAGGTADPACQQTSPWRGPLYCPPCSSVQKGVVSLHLPTDGKQHGSEKVTSNSSCMSRAAACAGLIANNETDFKPVPGQCISPSIGGHAHPDSLAGRVGAPLAGTISQLKAGASNQRAAVADSDTGFECQHTCSSPQTTPKAHGLIMDADLCLSPATHPCATATGEERCASVFAQAGLSDSGCSAQACLALQDASGAAMTDGWHCNGARTVSRLTPHGSSKVTTGSPVLSPMAGALTPAQIGVQ